MSVLNQLFNRGLLGAKCKTCLTMSILRIKLLQNKRFSKQNVWAAYVIMEMFCKFIFACVPILESQRDCPTDLQEAVESIIFAVPRCSDLLHVRNLFAAKYGKEFISAASEFWPDSKVNRTIFEKLFASAPSADIKLEVLKEIAREYNVEWDSSKTEAELRKNPEDLLNGPKNISVASRASSQLDAAAEPSITSTHDVRGAQTFKSRIYESNIPCPVANTSKHLTKTNSMGSKGTDRKDVRTLPSDVLERARAAIAAADRASSSARSAVELLNH
ncbi:hypothetical protein LIER_18616 [Lithospermum erythrorhizon]|uniref:Regulator of Vps4 activity in the MVB pathway protein n=1 Tax=Lithospermum erythrorhizon TaxID=34254 RepID=A0AAV3QFW6_LITER